MRLLLPAVGGVLVTVTLMTYWPYGIMLIGAWQIGGWANSLGKALS